MAKTVKSTVVIPAFNNAALTKQCVEAVLRIGGCRVLVVNDASTDKTAQILASFGNRIKVITHKTNQGFAKTCNDGAKAARTEFVVFLNNDTVPQQGWLLALEKHAKKNPKAAVVGAKLLYPNNTVQHAGVIICQDKYPRHIYTGFPADHPAVSKSRRFQIVTAAAMLVQKKVFDQAGGFDIRFRNGFEDVDLCLRLGGRGHEIHYCAGSVVQHLESVSPDRFKHDKYNVALYRKRWLSHVQPDDLQSYLEDGLLDVNYEGSFPLHLKVAPELAVLDAGRQGAAEKLLKEQSRLVVELTRENTRLKLETERRPDGSPELRYDDLRRQIREIIQTTVPANTTVLMVSKGDSLLLEMPGRQAWHFPQTERGTYAGFHPADSAAAIAHLKTLQVKGAQYLVFPATAFWWLEHYKGLKLYLEKHCQLLARRESVCLIYRLDKAATQKMVASGVRSMASGRKTNTAGTKRMRATGKHKVLFICHNHPWVMPGGAEGYALELYEALRDDSEFEPIFLARVAGHIPDSRRFRPRSPIWRLATDTNQFVFHTASKDFDTFLMTSRNQDHAAKHFRNFLQTHKPDVIHFQHTLFLGHEFIRLARMTLPDAAIVYTLHEYLPICHRNGQMIRTRNEELCLAATPQRCHECFPDVSPEAFAGRKESIMSDFALVDRFIAPSRFLLDRYVEWGIPKDKLEFEEYGRKTLPIVPQIHERQTTNRFGFFGQLNPFKGVNVLLKAMSLLATKADNSISRGQSRERRHDRNRYNDSAPHLWIHGANLEAQPGGFQAEFRSMLEANQANVTFIGRYDQASLPQLMANIDWVVVPSIWWENSPLVIQEAFAYGRPVICSNIGAMAEKVRDGVNGLHFQAGKPDSLARTIRMAATKTNLWDKLTANLPAVHSMQKHTQFLIQLYDSIMKSRRQPNLP